MPVIDLGSVVGPQGPQGATGATGAQGIQGNPGPNQVTDQTSTNLNGVLFGNQSRVTVKPVDSTPTADSTNLVSSGGTDKAIKGRVPVYGLGKNLLDNWYFLNPVNQRGESSYSASGAQFTIDRWRKVNCAVTVESDGIKITKTNTEMVRQAMPSAFWKSLLGQTVTLSVLGSDGLASATITMPSTLGSWDTTGPVLNGLAIDIAGNSSADGACYIRFFSSSPNGTEWKLYAIKLELGSEQTLCHNEGTAENPVWVLNEIPDYGEELRKCQRYFIALLPNGSTPLVGNGICISTTQATIMIPTPVTMRSSTPTITYSGTIKLWHGSVYGSSAPNLTAIINPALGSNGVSTTAQVASGLVAGEPALLQLRDNSPVIYISCEL